MHRGDTLSLKAQQMASTGEIFWFYGALVVLCPILWPLYIKITTSLQIFYNSNWYVGEKFLFRGAVDGVNRSHIPWYDFTTQSSYDVIMSYPRKTKSQHLRKRYFGDILPGPNRSPLKNLDIDIGMTISRTVNSCSKHWQGYSLWPVLTHLKTAVTGALTAAYVFGGPKHLKWWQWSYFLSRRLILKV